MARSPFSAARLLELTTRKGLVLGRTVEVKDVTESTNDDAFASAAQGAREGTVYVAEWQTRGRGRQGATWHSMPGEDLTFSVLLREAALKGTCAGLSLMCGLAVREAIARLITPPVLVKWPNDLLVEGRKLGGILVETRMAQGTVSTAVVGIGLNVGASGFPGPLSESATSLALLGHPSAEREDLLADILGELEARFALVREGGFRELLPELERFDALRGHEVHAGDVDGIAAGIAEDGSLLVERKDGSTARVHGGSVDCPALPHLRST
jgi:BirA family biotin operon repressor/biotin-[acetyl-CoA-carboxylase] ligase